MREMLTTNSIPWALSFMEAFLEDKPSHYGSPMLIYINLPRAFAKRRRPSVEEKGGSAMLQVVSAAKWRVSGFLFLEPVRDQLACKHDLQSRHGVALAEGYRMARGEIDYVASNRSIDPRGIRSAQRDLARGGRQR